ncbi:MAG: hypothetical protein K9M45_06390 [Kiritimatiellales bacterium]|nr:hypothetical protein [Kiritimatiellales bacterium]
MGKQTIIVGILAALLSVAQAAYIGLEPDNDGNLYAAANWIGGVLPMGGNSLTGLVHAAEMPTGGTFGIPAPIYDFALLQESGQCVRNGDLNLRGGVTNASVFVPGETFWQINDATQVPPSYTNLYVTDNLVFWPQYGGVVELELINGHIEVGGTFNMVAKNGVTGTLNVQNGIFRAQYFHAAGGTVNMLSNGTAAVTLGRFDSADRNIVFNFEAGNKGSVTILETETGTPFGTNAWQLLASAGKLTVSGGPTGLEYFVISNGGTTIRYAGALHLGTWTPFWRARPVIGEWLAGGSGIESVPDYLKRNSFACQMRDLDKEIHYADHLNAVRLIGGWNEGGGAENPVPADVADLVYTNQAGELQYRWDKLAARLDPYINIGYTNLTLVLDNIPYCFPSNIVMESYGQVAPPVDFSDWQTFVSNLCVELVDLYGYETVNRFRFRQGTEAQGTKRFAGTQEEYFKIYDHSAAAIKSVLPDAQFGPFNQAGGKSNPAGNNVNMVALAQHCASEPNHSTGAVGTPFDFISISSYIAQPTHSHDPQAEARTCSNFFYTVQAELPQPVPFEIHELGILNCEAGLATGEPGARGAGWFFHLVTTLREIGVSRWYHWDVFDRFRESGVGLHYLLDGPGWFLAVLDRTAGGEGFTLNTSSPTNTDTQVKAVGVFGGGRDWILAGIFNPNRLSHDPETVSIHVPLSLLRANEGDKVLWTSLNQTNAAHYLIRKDLEDAGMLNAEFSAVPEQLASVRTMTTNSMLSAEQDYLGGRIDIYQQAVVDSLTLKPFPGTISTNGGDVVFTVTLTPPETAVICVGPDRTADGTPYTWLDSHGLATQGYPAAEQSDTDNDQFTAAQEYITLTDPLDPLSFFTFQGSFEAGIEGMDIIFPTNADRWYSIYSRTSLVHGTWALLKDGVPGTGGLVAVSDTNRCPVVFYRLATGLP